MAVSDEHMKFTDEQLLTMHLQSDDNHYLGLLYDRYLPLIYGVCLKYMGNMNDASDAVMDVFEELVVKVERYEIKEFRTWVYSVAKNHCLQKLRKKNREIPVDPSEKIMEFSGIVHLLSEEDKDEGDGKALEQCLEKLPEKQKECIEMFFYQDKSYADISAETLYSVKNVKSYLQNGKRNLKLCIEKHKDEIN